MNNDEVRTLGQYPISVGTSGALEGLFSTGANSGAPAMYKDYQCLILNLRTLARNFIGSFKTAHLQTLDRQQLLDGFRSEMLLLNNIVSEQSNNKLTVSCYYNTYLRIHKYFNKLNVKTKFTVKQQLAMQLELMFCEDIKNENGIVSKTYNIEYTNDVIRQGMRHNIILTHYTIDLLLTSLNVHLLESYTGKVKLPHQFNTKLKKTNEYTPFNKYTVQVLGDKSGYVLGVSSKFKNELLKICKDANLTAVTPDKKFVTAMRRRATPELKSLINSM